MQLDLDKIVGWLNRVLSEAPIAEYDEVGNPLPVDWYIRCRKGPSVRTLKSVSIPRISSGQFTNEESIQKNASIIFSNLRSVIKSATNAEIVRLEAVNSEKNGTVFEFISFSGEASEDESEETTALAPRPTAESALSETTTKANAQLLSAIDRMVDNAYEAGQNKAIAVMLVDERDALYAKIEALEHQLAQTDTFSVLAKLADHVPALVDKLPEIVSAYAKVTAAQSAAQSPQSAGQPAAKPAKPPPTKEQIGERLASAFDKYLSELGDEGMPGSVKNQFVMVFLKHNEKVKAIFGLP